MPARDHLDRRHLTVSAGRSRQSLSSGITKQYVFMPHRLAPAKGRAISRTTSRNRQIQIWWEKEQRRSAPATVPDRLDADNESLHSSRDYLEGAHRECLPGARIIIARPRSVRHEEGVFTPLLRPAEFISQTPDGRSILGVLQRIEDVFFSFRVPFLAVPLDLQAPIKRDELRCILSYNPASDECEFFCNSHDVAIIGERSSKSYMVKKGRIQNIEPGMWTIAVPGNPVVWNPASREDSFSRYRPLVEFLLLKRTYSTTITQPAATGSPGTAVSPGECGNMVDASSARTPVEGTVAEFIMGTVEPRPRNRNMTEAATLSSEGPFYQLQDGETAHVVTSPAGSNNAGIEQGYAETSEAYKVTRLQKIDKSNNSSVFACVHSKLPHTTLVAKALNVRPKTRNWIGSLASHWLNEMEILRTLNHKNIVKILEWDARFYTVYLEHLPGSLAHYPRNNPGFTRKDAARIMADVASALAYLEEQGVSHNDIKPRNISYSPTHGATVLDFGLATRCGGGDGDGVALVPRGAGGTSWYMPPEAIEEGARSISGNVWALGITMLYVLGIIDAPEMYGCQWDFGDNDSMRDPNGTARCAMEAWIDKVCIAVDDELDRSDPVQLVVAWMLEQEPEHRLTAKGVVAELTRYGIGEERWMID